MALGIEDRLGDLTCDNDARAGQSVADLEIRNFVMVITYISAKL
jgi:hypothetical protein